MSRKSHLSRTLSVSYIPLQKEERHLEESEVGNVLLTSCSLLDLDLSSPTPFSYSVRQKGYFHLLPLTVGISSPLISLFLCLFTLFHLINSYLSITL